MKRDKNSRRRKKRIKSKINYAWKTERQKWFQKAKEQRENETKTNRTTILKTDEVMSFDKDREVKQHLNLNNTAEREKVTRSVAFLRVF